MGASESKLVFKQGIFRLSEDKDIPANDPYWTGFWELPESVEDVFSLFSPLDIRRTRDENLSNLETLILAVTSRLNVLKNHPSFPDPDLAPDRDCLNCIRVLTRILPYIYEAENLADWEERFFWGVRRRKTRKAQIATEVLFDEAQETTLDVPNTNEDVYEEVKPLAEELIDTLTDLLFFTGFTIPQLTTAKSKVSYAIWQSGVGCKQSIGTSKELETNRCEILRLLLTMTSKAMYMPSSLLPVQGVRAITYIATCPDKQIVLSMLCSLLNTTMKYNPAAWRVPYDHVVWKDPRQGLVIYSLQFLLVLLLYPIPEEGHGPPPKNFYRHFFGRLHRPEDFQFIAEGMTRILNQPMQATSSYLPGSQKSVKWAPEMIMLFWEALQCNKRFRSFIIDSNRSHDFVILCLFYAIEYKTDPSKQGVVRMCVFVLQTMSVEANFGRSLNNRFEAQETLPASVRINNFRGTYADFLIISIHTLITASKGKLDAIYPALLAIINNIAAYTEHLSATSSSKLLQLFSSMSAPSFLLANETNHTLLQSLLESMNAIIEHRYSKNPMFIYAILKSRKKLEALRTFTLESGQEELERMARRRKELASSNEPSPNHTDANRTASRTPSLSSVPEQESAFTIGDDDDSDEDNDVQDTPAQSSPSLADSRAPSISSSIDDSVPVQLRGMSEKARGKMPVGQHSFSRQNSSTSLGGYFLHSMTSNSGFIPTPHWIETWLPELPLHTCLTVIRALEPHLPSNSATNTTAASDTSNRQFLHDLPAFESEPSIAMLLADPSPIRVHLFEWSPLSLGWYESLLWGLIFAAEMVVGAASGGTSGAVGVWNGTSIKLFQVREGKAEGPSLMKPQGAVDAVGSNLVQRIGNLNLRGRVASMAGPEPQHRVREV